jgi:hypothetical protein
VRLRTPHACVRESVIAVSRKSARQDSAGHIAMQAEHASMSKGLLRGSYPLLPSKNIGGFRKT